MRLRRYRARHLRLRPKRRGPVVVGTATAVWMAGSAAEAGTYRVRRGDTLSRIAARYGTTVAALVRANNLADRNYIVAGRRLRVPGRPGGDRRGARVHLVRSGDTLSRIAARYGTTVAALARANDLADPNVIVAGRRLRVSGAAASHRPRTRASSLADHTVRAGETLWEIAARYRTTVAALARANDLADPSLIVAGQRLRVPVGAAEAVGVPPTRTWIGRLIQRHASAHGVSPSLAKAVAWQESGWQQDVRSSAGAIGVMQVMPGTGRDVNRRYGESLNIRTADGNVHLGVMYLRDMLRAMGTERRALAAYYTGPGNVQGRLSRIQRAYVDSIRALKRRF